MGSADRTRRRFPLQALLLGAACLMCCLPPVGGLLAAASGVLATLGAAAFGAGFLLAAGIGVAIASTLGGAWWLTRRRAARCVNCGGQACAC